MFSVKVGIPQLDDLYIEDHEFVIDIYKNLQVKLLVKSSNYSCEEIVDIMKMYDKFPIILNNVTSFMVTPGYARIEDDDKLEIQFYGYVANLYKKYGYFTENGNGTIDYTIIDDATGKAVGVSAIDLASRVLMGTNFNLTYAPAVDKNGMVKMENKIYVRGEWLSRAEWMYEIAKNCFYYEYVGPDIKINGQTYKPDFTTDNSNDLDANNGKLIDCCNVLYDDNGNISIGIAGCEYLGDNNWRKITTDITDFVLTPNDTVYNFIEYDNAVVQGGELSDREKKRTYLAKPIKLDSHEVFSNAFNKENYEFDGLSKKESWTLQSDGSNSYLQCESFRSGDCNFVVYDFATLDGLVSNFDESNIFQVNLADMSGGIPPWPAKEAHRCFLQYQTRRMGLFFNLQYPYPDYFDDKDENEREHQMMDGYFFYLEMVTHPETVGYETSLHVPKDLARVMIHELLHTVPGLESSDNLHRSDGFWNWMIMHGSPYAPYTNDRYGCADTNELLDYFYKYLMEQITTPQPRTIVHINIPMDLITAATQYIPADKFIISQTAGVLDDTYIIKTLNHDVTSSTVPWATFEDTIVISPHDMAGTTWNCGGIAFGRRCSVPVTLADYEVTDTSLQFNGFVHEYFLVLATTLNMYAATDDDYDIYPIKKEDEDKRILIRRRFEFDESMLDVPHTIKLEVVPEVADNVRKTIQKLTFKANVWKTSNPDTVVSYEKTFHMSDYTQPQYKSGRVGLFTWARYPNEVAGEEDLDTVEHPFIVKFDDFIIKCQSETLYGQVNKPIIMHRDRAINNNTTGVCVAQALLETKNRDKDIKVKVDPLIFYERTIVPGQWVSINYPKSIAGEYRVCGININPEEVEFCLNHSDIKFIDQFDGIRKLIDVLDSF